MHTTNKNKTNKRNATNEASEASETSKDTMRHPMHPTSNTTTIDTVSINTNSSIYLSMCFSSCDYPSAFAMASPYAAVRWMHVWLLFFMVMMRMMCMMRMLGIVSGLWVPGVLTSTLQCTCEYTGSDIEAKPSSFTGVLTGTLECTCEYTALAFNG